MSPQQIQEIVPTETPALPADEASLSDDLDRQDNDSVNLESMHYDTFDQELKEKTQENSQSGSGDADENDEQLVVERPENNQMANENLIRDLADSVHDPSPIDFDDKQSELLIDQVSLNKMPEALNVPSLSLNASS